MLQPLRRTEWFRMLVSCVLLSLAMPAAGWQRQSTDHDAVQLWTQTTAANPYSRVRAEVTIAAPIFQMLYLLQNAATQQEWLPYSHRVDVLQQPTPTQTLVRFETEAQWPFSARDAITLFSVSQPNDQNLLITMENKPTAAPPVAGIERITAADGYWLLTALPDCHTHVRYESGSVWGGNIPQWLVNQLNVRISRTALLNLRAWAPGQPRHASIPEFLQPVPEHAQCP